jgi:hypothetical protein
MLPDNSILTETPRLLLGVSDVLVGIWAAAYQSRACLDLIINISVGVAVVLVIYLEMFHVIIRNNVITSMGGSKKVYIPRVRAKGLTS